MSQASSTKTKWSMRRKVLTAVIVLVGVSFAGTMLGMFWELHEANNALRSFGEALSSKEYARAYDLTSQEFRASANFKTFVKVHDDLSARMGDLKNLVVTESDVKERGDGWYGTAEVNINFSHGSLPFSFTVKKENGNWKVYNYHEL